MAEAASARLASVCSFAIARTTYRLDGVRLLGGLVRAIALDPREAQRQAARVVRARLYVVEGHFHHELRADMDGIRVATDLELEQLLGLPLEHLVGHALERLAQHDEAAGLRVARAEMHIREPSPASSMPPLRREHHE